MKFFDLFFRSNRNLIPYIIGFLWSFGMSVGILMAFGAEPHISSWMCVLSDDNVSILGLLLVTLVPFLVSCIAIRFHLLPILFAVAFVKSFIYSYCRCLILQIFANAGWLFNFLVFFSDTLATFVLLFYWYYGLHNTKSIGWKALLMCVCVVVLFCIIDYCVIAPLLIEIMA